MPITEAQRLARREAVGSSDVAALLGIDPYGRSAYDVWLEKTEGLQPDPTQPALVVGNYMERAVLDWAETQLGTLARGESLNTLAAPDSLPLRVNLDAMVLETMAPVDAKTAGIIGPLDVDAWGEPGTDEIPEHYFAQLQAQLCCLPDAQVAYLPVLLVRRGFVLYRVERHEAMCEAIIRAVREFWPRVERREPPMDCAPSIAYSKLRRREAGKVVQVAPEIVAAWRAAKDAVASAADQEEGALMALMAALGDAEAADGGEAGIVTYRAHKQARMNLMRLREMHPDIAAEFTEIKSVRTLRWKAAAQEITP